MSASNQVVSCICIQNARLVAEATFRIVSCCAGVVLAKVVRPYTAIWNETRARAAPILEVFAPLERLRARLCDFVARIDVARM